MRFTGVLDVVYSWIQNMKCMQKNYDYMFEENSSDEFNFDSNDVYEIVIVGVQIEDSSQSSSNHVEGEEPSVDGGQECIEESGDKSGGGLSLDNSNTLELYRPHLNEVEESSSIGSTLSKDYQDSDTIEMVKKHFDLSTLDIKKDLFENWSSLMLELDRKVTQGSFLRIVTTFGEANTEHIHNAKMEVFTGEVNYIPHNTCTEIVHVPVDHSSRLNTDVINNLIETSAVCITESSVLDTDIFQEPSTSNTNAYIRHLDSLSITRDEENKQPVNIPDRMFSYQDIREKWRSLST